MTFVSDHCRYGSVVAQPTVKSTRRRAKHDPEISKREILSSAEELLRELPLREITVEAIMSRTGLKRPAFYAHFRDRNDVVLHVVQALGDEVAAMTSPWLDSNGESLTDIRTALEGLTATYVKHGPLLRALSDAASADAQVDDAYRHIVEGLITATATHIRDEQTRGHIDDLPDVDETARALIWMEERYLIEALGRTPTTDPQLVVDVLYRIWTGALYATAGPPR